MSTPDRSRRRRAIALRYNAATDIAPVVVATGQGELAERIIALARERDIPIEEDPNLALALAQLDVGAVVPPELYAVLAEVFAYIYRLKSAH